MRDGRLRAVLREHDHVVEDLILGAPGSRTKEIEVDAGRGGDIRVDDAQLLFQGEYSRHGLDLVVERDGVRLTVHDFFRPGKRPNLVSQEGASLSGDVVEALALSSHGPRYAQAGGAPAPTTIGRVETVSGTASVLRNGSAVALNVGDLVYQGDVVQTGGGSSLGVTFIDGSAFSLLAGARMVLNDMVYAPGGAGNSALLSLVQGSISFVAGQVAKTGDMRVDTPVATMGIRGTAVNVEISADNGTTRFSVMREPDGRVGSYVLYSKTDPTLVLATVSQVDVAVTIEANGTLVSVVKTPGDLAAEVTIVQRIFELFGSAQANPIPVTPGPQPAPPTGPQSGGGGGSSTPQNGSSGGGDAAPPITTPPPVNTPFQPETGTGDPATGQPPGASASPSGGATPERQSATASTTTVANAEGGAAPSAPSGNTATTGQSAEAGGAPNATGTTGAPPVQGTGAATGPTDAGQTGSTGESPAAAGAAGGTGTADAVAPLAPKTVAVEANEVVAAFSRAEGVLARDGASEATLAAEHVVSAQGAAASAVPVGSGLTIVAGTYGTLAIQADGSYSYVALRATALAQGETANDVFTFLVAEADGSQTASTLTFRVEGQNDAPSAAPDRIALDLSAGATAAAATRSGGVLANDSDPDRGETATLTVSAVHAGDAADTLVAPGGAATVAGRYGVLTLAADGTYSYVADRASALGVGVSGGDDFVYTITDPNGATSRASLTFAVTGVNDAPVANADQGAVAQGGTAAGATRAAGLLGNDVDPDAGETGGLALVSVSHGGGAIPVGDRTTLSGTYGTLTVAADGTYSYAADHATALAQGQSDVDVFAYTVTDAHGATATAELRVAVTGVNDAPTAAADGASVAQGGTVGSDTRAAGLLGNDVDPDSGETGGLALVSVSHGGGAVQVGDRTTLSGTYGTLTVSADGAYSYAADHARALAAGQSDVDVFAYTVTDAHGATATAELRVAVTGVNDAPTAAADGASVAQGGTVGADTRAAGLLGNDVDPDNGESARLSVTSIRAGTAGASSDLTPTAQSYLAAGHDLITGLGGLAGFGENVLSPNDDDSTGAIDITAVFGGQGLNFFGRLFTTIYVNNNGNITFTGPSGDFTPDPIAGTAQNPIIAPFWYDVDTRSGALPPTPGGHSTGSDLVYYDLDPINHVLTVTWDDVGYFPGGTDKLNAYQLQLIGHGGGDFDILFRYEATNYGGSTGARAGYSAGDAASSYELPQSGDAAAMTSLAGVAGNTGLVGVDVFEVRGGVAGSGAASVSGSTTIAGGYGTLTLASDGTYSYVADHAAALAQGQHGADRFTYTIADPAGATSLAELTFDVTGVNDAPVAQDGSATVNEGDTVQIDFTATDVDGDSLTYRIGTGPQHGTVASQSGSYVYIPDDGYHGSDSFTFTAYDGQANSNVATISITVVDDAMNVAPQVQSSYPRDVYRVGRDPIRVDDRITVSDSDNAYLDHATIRVSLGDLSTQVAQDRLTVRSGSQFYFDSGTFDLKGFEDGGVIHQSYANGVLTLTSDASHPASAADFQLAFQGVEFSTSDQFATGERHIQFTASDGTSTSYATDEFVKVIYDSSDVFVLRDSSTLTASVPAPDNQGPFGLTYTFHQPAHGTVTQDATDPRGFTYVVSASYIGSDAFAYDVSNADGVVYTGHITIGVDPNQGGLFGSGLASLGDRDGDGIAESAIGAPGLNFGNGIVFIGRSGGDGYQLQGQGGEQVGHGLADLGDLNGDGVRDFVAGAPGANGGAGAAYVVFERGAGGVDALATSSLDGTSAEGFTITGATMGDHAGSAVASAGYVNGDALPDILVGAPDASDGAGAAYLVYGKADTGPVALGDVQSGASSVGIVITGAAGDHLGFSAAGGGDLDADGFADLVLGAPGDGATAGAVYLIRGANGLSNLDVTDSGSFSRFIKIAGETPGDQFGYAVANLGDVNGDGYDDFAVGAPHAAAQERAEAGIVYVVYGSGNLSTVSTVDLALIDRGIGGFTISGAVAGDHLGSAVASAGDVNGDGLADIIVGAPGSSNTNHVGNGAAYLVLSSATGQNVDLAAAYPVLTGDQAEGHLGTTVATTGDNGSGVAGFQAGSPQAFDAGNNVQNGGYSSSTGYGGAYAFTVYGDDRDNTVEGTTGADVLGGFEGADRIVGHGGADLLIGGAGNDTFVFTSDDAGGRTVIADFHPASTTQALGQRDLIEVQYAGANTDDLLANAMQVNSHDTLITLDVGPVQAVANSSHTILLKNVLAASLTANDFILPSS